MSVKIISNDNNKIILEVIIDLGNENFLETEEIIMDKVNEIGRTVTIEALNFLEIEDRVIIIDKNRLYAKDVKKNIKAHMGR
jgi:hypothetical protein